MVERLPKQTQKLMASFTTPGRMGMKPRAKDESNKITSLVFPTEQGGGNQLMLQVRLRTPHNSFMAASNFARGDVETHSIDRNISCFDLPILQTRDPASPSTPTKHRHVGQRKEGISGQRKGDNFTGLMHRSPILKQKRMVFSLESAASNSPKSTTRTQRKPASGEKAIQEAGGYRIGTMPSATQRDTQKSIIDRASGAALKSDVSKGGKDIFEMVQDDETGTVSFRTVFGTWLSARPEIGSLLCQSKKCGSWERFILFQYRTPRASPRYCLHTVHGTYVSFSSDGAVRHINQMLSEVCMLQIERVSDPTVALPLRCRCQRSLMPSDTVKARKALWRSKWRNSRPRVLVVLREHYLRDQANSHIIDNQSNDPFTYRADCPVEEFLEHFKRFVVDPLHAIGSMVHIFIGCGDQPVGNFFPEDTALPVPKTIRRDASVGLWDACRAMFGNAVVGYFDPAHQEEDIPAGPGSVACAIGTEYNAGRLPAVAFPWGRVLELLKQVEASRLVAYDVLCLCRVDVVWQVPINEWGTDPRHINFLFKEPSSPLPQSPISPTSEKRSDGMSASDVCHILPRAILPKFIAAIKAIHRIERQRFSFAITAARNPAADFSNIKWTFRDVDMDLNRSERGPGGVDRYDASTVGTRDLLREVRRIVGGASVHGSGSTVRICLDNCQGWPSQEVRIEDAPWVLPNPLYSFGEHRPMCHRGSAGHHVMLVASCNKDG